MNYTREEVVKRIALMEKEEFEKLLNSYQNNAETLNYANEVVERIILCQNARDKRTNNEKLAEGILFNHLVANEFAQKLIHLGIVFANKELFVDLDAYYSGDSKKIASVFKTSEQAVKCQQALNTFNKEKNKQITKTR